MNGDLQMGSVQFGPQQPENRLTRTDWVILGVGVIAHAFALAIFLRWLKRQ